MTLYLKYRATNLDELDIESVRESLKKIVSSGKIPHAFLFAGPKGTGKTSAARILAKIINCEWPSKSGKPCDKCEQCLTITKGTNLDVVEMDAASHRGIDDVRSLRDAVKLAPVKARKKIYIIDEAHMLTTEASNALLKTLEEPPEHVVFILATTNPEKLIETVRSRTTYIPFRKAETSEIVRSLKRVVEGEKIKIKDDAIELIAKNSEGAFRDAIKTLEQLVAEEKDLSSEFLEEYLFQKKSFDLDSFVGLLVEKDVKRLIEEIGKLASKGVSIENFTAALLARLQAGLLSKVGIGEESLKEINKDDLIILIDLLMEGSKNSVDSPIEELPLEIAVIKWCGESVDEPFGTVHEKKNSRPDKVGVGADFRDSSAVVEGVSSSISSVPSGDAQTVTSSIHSPKEVSPGMNMGMEGVNDDVWRSILSLIKPINASVEALLRAARPLAYDGKALTLGVFYRFHKERLEDIHHRTILEDAVTKVLQSPTRVICTLVDPPPKKIIEEAKVEPVLTEGKDEDIIKVAEEIFGN